MYTYNNKQNKNKHKIIPGWNDNVRYYYDKALFWHKLWKQCECPTQGYVFEIRKYTRHKYHEMVKLTKNKTDEFKASNMANAILDNRSRDL